MSDPPNGPQPDDPHEPAFPPAGLSRFWAWSFPRAFGVVLLLNAICLTPAASRGIRAILRAGLWALVSAVQGGRSTRRWPLWNAGPFDKLIALLWVLLFASALGLALRKKWGCVLLYLFKLGPVQCVLGGYYHADSWATPIPADALPSRPRQRP